MSRTLSGLFYAFAVFVFFAVGVAGFATLATSAMTADWGDEDADLIVEAVNAYDRLRAIEAAARWLTRIHADSAVAVKGSLLWEDLQSLRAALKGTPDDPE
jgi:hypothetical protein